VQKLGGLPEAQSDFVFAVLGEELGFMGVLGVLALFVLFAWRGFALALRQEEPFFRLMAYGITALLSIQSGLNMAVISGMVPATGIPMPFFAAGGSHLLVSMILCGLLLNISIREVPTGRRGGSAAREAFGAVGHVDIAAPGETGHV